MPEARQRMTGAQRHRKRCQERLNIVMEAIGKRRTRVVGERVPRRDPDAQRFERLPALVEQIRLSGADRSGRIRHGRHFRGRREAVVSALGGIFARRREQSGHAHHEELVDVRRHDRQEAETFSKRRLLVLDERQYTMLKRQKAQFGVEEQIDRHR